MMPISQFVRDIPSASYVCMVLRKLLQADQHDQELLFSTVASQQLMMMCYCRGLEGSHAYHGADGLPYRLSC